MVPAMPHAMPAILAQVNFSSLVPTCATTTMKIGVVALRIEAMPEVMRVSPQAIRIKGITLLSRPSSRNRFQTGPAASGRLPPAATD